MRRLLIAGTNSGCGKTTVTCALLSALTVRGLNVAAFKCGPDYIDPMFHRATLGVKAYTLDPFFLDGEGLRAHLTAHAGGLSIIEGAMGYYDGIAATDEASAYTVARETSTPVVLVMSARGAGHSLSAVIEGFTRHRKDSHIAGVIFNDASEARANDLAQMARDAGTRSYGTMPRNEAFSLASRHLGLLMPSEISDLHKKLQKLGQQAEQTLDIDGLLALSETAPVLMQKSHPPARQAAHVRLAVARDAAFCFLYQENLDLLQALGCELVFFSPLGDRALPESIHGLYLCGGYPELHAAALAENRSMRESIRKVIEGGLPTIAECGGFLYLHETLGDFPACGVIKGAAYETKRLQRFGYITLTAARDNLLCRAGESIRTHEFHYWECDLPGEGFIAHKAGRDLSCPCIHATDSLYAGFPHLFFPANPTFAKNFANAMVKKGGIA